MLKKLFSRKSAQSTEVKPLPPGIVNSIRTIAGSRTLPSMPFAAQRAFQLSIDPNSEIQDFVEVIESDEGLSGRIIKIANSVYFGRSQLCSTINDAVVNIGMNELKNLLNANTLCDIFPSKHPARAQLWMHNIGVALIAREMAARFAPGLKNEALLSGLVHDIGKLLLLQKRPDEYEKILRKGLDSEESSCQLEQDQFVCNHCEVGQLLAQQWNFPANIIDVIATHHSYNVSDLGANLNKLPELIAVADILCHAIGIGHPLPNSGLKRKNLSTAAEILEKLGVTTQEQASMLEGLQRIYQEEYQMYVRA